MCIFSLCLVRVINIIRYSIKISVDTLFCFAEINKIIVNHQSIPVVPMDCEPVILVEDVFLTDPFPVQPLTHKTDGVLSHVEGADAMTTIVLESSAERINQAVGKYKIIILDHYNPIYMTIQYIYILGATSC